MSIPRIRGVSDGPLSEREVAAYEAGMLDGADQILEQDESLRARVQQLEAALGRIDRTASDDQGKWCTGCKAYEESFLEELKHKPDCAWTVLAPTKGAA